MEAGRFKEARELADALLTDQPSEALAYITHADVLASQLQLDRATADIRKALSMDPCSGRAFLIASEIEQKGGKSALAWSHLQLAHKLSPNDDDVVRAWMQNIPSEDRYTELEQYAATTKLLKPADLEDFKGRIVASKATAHANCTVIAPTGGTTIPLQHASDNGWLQAEVRFGDVKRNFGVAASGDGIVLYEDTAKALGLKVGEHYSSHSLYRVGHFRYWTSVVPVLRIGEVEFRNCAISVQEQSAGGGFGVIGLGMFRDFLVEFDPAGTLTLRKLPPLPATVADAGNKWSTVTSDPAGVRSRSQGMWQPLDASVPAGMESWGHLYDINGIKAVMTQVGPGDAIPFELAWQQHFETLNYNHTKEAVSLSNTARALGKPLSKSTLDSFGSSRYFVGVQGHVLPVSIWNTANYDQFDKARGTDLAGTLGYPTIGNLKMTVDFRDGLVKFERTAYKKYAGF